MISLDPASTAERPVLENLFQLYAYDWSELGWLEVGRNGRFAEPSLASYWQDDDRHPFLIRVDGRLAGFALVTARSRLTGAAGVFDMAEFFVMRKYRRRGVGFAAASAAFDRFTGRWEIDGATRMRRRPRFGGGSSPATPTGAIRRPTATTRPGSAPSRVSRAARSRTNRLSWSCRPAHRPAG
jgi:predicted acetyltransferase